MDFEELIGGWDGEEVCLRLDEPTGAWMFVAVHSTALGPGMGGTRLKTYPAPQEALADALRLARAMTLKQAAADLPYGGGKAVVAPASIPARGSPERRELLLRYAGLVNSLRGTYVTAADMNTDASDMDVVAERTPHVLGCSPDRGGSGDPAEDTATGVFHGLRTSVDRVFGSDELEGRSVLIQGVGSVGSRLAERLAAAGASLLLADQDTARVEEVAARLDAVVIPADAVIGTPCDVFSPCATGGILDGRSVSLLRCRVVAGAANNQLASSETAGLLRGADILYAPDFVINAGGVIHLAGAESLGWDDEQMAARLESIGDTLTQVFDAAEAEGITTESAAERMARAKIEAATTVRGA